MRLPRPPHDALAFGLFALAACSSASPPSPSSGAGGANGAGGGGGALSCLPPPSCGGDYVGTWALTAGCAVIAVPLAGCGTFEMPFTSASGAVTFGADGTYHVQLESGASSPVIIPAACTGVKSCGQLDSPLVSCTGQPASGCVCTAVPVDETGTYADASGVLELTSTGSAATTLKTVGGWCVHGAGIELLLGGSLVVGGARK